MSGRCAEIAIVGAGPAGAHLATVLAEAGRDVVLFDPRGAWEKPCGGGVPTRAIREYGFLLEDPCYPRRLISRVKLLAPGGRCVSLTLEEPFVIYSREVLNQLVLDRAIRSGAEFHRRSVVSFGRNGDHWDIEAADEAGDGVAFRARYLVGADGAASSTRRKLIGIFPKRDLALAFGYNVADADGEAEPAVTVQFPPDFTGYIWAFPRPGVMNFGVASKLGERTSDELRSILTEFVARYYGGSMPAQAQMEFFGAKIPTLDAASWKDLRAAGEGWALVGDAAGFCDPITGEGIYYAFKSAQVLGEVLVEAGTDYNQAQTRYESRWRAEFGRDLQRASQMLPRFYRGRIFGQVFTDAMVLLSRYHRGTARILIRALVGDQSYLTLKQDLLHNVWRVF